jgi:hypothetical protein
MKKMLAMILLMSLMTVSCKSGGDSSSEDSSGKTTNLTNTDGNASPAVPDETPVPVPAPVPSPAPVSKVPALALSFKTNVTMYDFTSTQEEKYEDAVALVKKVVATEAFRKAVINHTYSGSKQFANNNGKTNDQIYQSILDAAEKLTPLKNNTLDVGVKMYYADNSVVGYTNPSITYFNVNTKFFNSYDINEVAGNLFHEWLHKVGYGHDSTATTRRPYSVPYAVGYMIRNIGENFL